MHSRGHFGAQMSHMQTHTHKIHHGSNLGEATTFHPLYYTLYMAMGPTPKCHFVLGLPSGNPEIPIVGTLAILGAHNFVCRPLIEMMSEEKL